MKVIEFIKSHKNWEKILSKEPYNIKIKKDNGYIILKYSQTESDFGLDIVRECRGLIIRESNYEIVCLPFTKFFNVKEQYADEIDWESAKVQEKIDGSLIKVWCDNSSGFPLWKVSTNGTINAFKADIGNDLCPIRTFGELFTSVLPKGLINSLDIDNTYMFELVSPYTKVVVPYSKVDIYHIGTRNNKTGEELDIDIGIQKPRVYELKTEEQVVNAAKDLPFDNEGYVVVDKDYHRVKIKSPAYIEAHRLVSGGLTKEKILDMIRINEQSEFLSYFPEYSEIFQEIEQEYLKFSKNLKKMEKRIRQVISHNFTRKEFAETVMGRYKEYSQFAFLLYDNKITGWEQYLSELSSKNIVGRLGDL